MAPAGWHERKVTLMDHWQYREKIAMIGVVAVQWLVVVSAPAMLLGCGAGLDPWTATLFAAMTGYCFFTGYRAWRRRWRSRFILRLVIPTGLLIVSSVGFGFARWKGVC